MKRIGAIAVVFAALAAACNTSEGNDSESSENAVGQAAPTTMIRGQADAIRNLNLVEKAEWFKATPFSAAGIPMIMFRLFPDFAKEVDDAELKALWGESVADLPAVGLRANTTDGEVHALALGLGYIRAAKALIPGTEGTPLDVTSFQVAGLTCGACHVSRIRAGGQNHFILGNGNIEFDPNKFGDALVKTVSHPKFTGDTFRKIILRKGIGPWEFESVKMLPQQGVEVAVFMNTIKKVTDTDKATCPRSSAPCEANVSDIIVAKVKAKVLERQGRVDRELGGLYQSIGAPETLHGHTPGRVDALGKIAVISGAHALTAAPVDLPAVWRQLDHEYAQFDGSIRDFFFRNLAASVGVSGNITEEANRRQGCNGRIQSCTDQRDLNTPNAFFLSDFVTLLPPPKYADLPSLKQPAADSVTAGAKLFATHCSSCHSTVTATATGGAKTVRTPLTVDKGADPARANQLNTSSIGDIAATLQNSCRNGMQVFESNGRKVDMRAYEGVCDVKPSDILFDQTATPGYVGQRLNGIAWTAPYLHNGSIPNLRALLVPSLRDKYETFWRGNIEFDEVNIGYRTDVGIDVYDTTIRGNTNKGHSSPEMLGGRTWEDGSKDLTDLLNYMKTL